MSLDPPGSEISTGILRYPLLGIPSMPHIRFNLCFITHTLLLPPVTSCAGLNAVFWFHTLKYS